MKSKKQTSLVAAVLSISAGVLFIAFRRPFYFNNLEYLGGLIFLEILAAVVWDYPRRFFPVLILVFLFAGTAVPLQSVWTPLRWLVLGVGALAGIAVYMKERLPAFGIIHLTAFFCVLAATVSAVVSAYPRVSLLKALSLLLLFVYGSCGARVALVHREKEFVRALLIGSEVLIYFSTAEYFVFRHSFFGNPNSLGAVMGVACAPIMLWGILSSAHGPVRNRRIFAFILSMSLLLSSYARAAIAAAAITCIVFCILLGRYRLLVKGTALVFSMAVVVATLAPLPNSQDPSTSTTSAFLFKGKEESGLLGSRQSVWDRTVSSIQDHPWFGSGFGSVSVGYEEEIAGTPTFSSTDATTREHGNSYLAILEGVGLLGVVPFVILVIIVIRDIYTTLSHLFRTRDPSSPAVLIALMLVAGLTNAFFEDWLFAVGSYLCAFFWSLAFILPDALPASVPAKVQPAPVPARVFWRENVVPYSR